MVSCHNAIDEIMRGGRPPKAEIGVSEDEVYEQKKPQRPVVFMDVHGVITHSSDKYHRTPEDVQLVSGAKTALEKLAKTHDILLFTNQPVAKGKIESEQHIVAAFTHILDKLPKGSVKAVYAATHSGLEGASPEHKEFETFVRSLGHASLPLHKMDGGIFLVPGKIARKPGTGMLIAAAHSHGIDLAKAFVIGDSKAKEGVAAQAAGIPARNVHIIRTDSGASLLQAVSKIQRQKK